MTAVVERKFHFTTYPFSVTDKEHYVKVRDINEGDWVLLEASGDVANFYRVTHVDKSGLDQTLLYFHGYTPMAFRYTEDLVLVRDPTVPEAMTDPIQEMRDAITEIEEWVKLLRKFGKLDAVANLLDTKANLLIAITEARRS